MNLLRLQTLLPTIIVLCVILHSSIICLFLTLRHNIVTGVILDSGVNLSDHMPLVYSFKLNLTMQSKKSTVPASTHKRYSWRWHKANLSSYYQCSELYLRNIDVSYLCDCSETGCHVTSHLQSIDIFLRINCISSATSISLSYSLCALSFTKAFLE